MNIQNKYIRIFQKIQSNQCRLSSTMSNHLNVSDIQSVEAVHSFEALVPELWQTPKWKSSISASDICSRLFDVVVDRIYSLYPYNEHKHTLPPPHTHISSNTYLYNRTHSRIIIGPNKYHGGDVVSPGEKLDGAIDWNLVRRFLLKIIMWMGRRRRRRSVAGAALLVSVPLRRKYSFDMFDTRKSNFSFLSNVNPTPPQVANTQRQIIHK